MPNAGTVNIPVPWILLVGADSAIQDRRIHSPDGFALLGEKPSLAKLPLGRACLGDVMKYTGLLR